MCPLLGVSAFGGFTVICICTPLNAYPVSTLYFFPREDELISHIDEGICDFDDKLTKSS